MSSTRHARMIAGLGVAGVLAGSGLVMAGPAGAATPATVNAAATYSCSIPGTPITGQNVAVTFSLPAAAFTKSVPVGTKVAAIPVTAQADIPGTLVGGIVQLLAVAGATPAGASLPLPTALTGAITGNSSLGGQSLPTTLAVDTPLTSLLSTLLTPLQALGLPVNNLGDLNALTTNPKFTALLSTLQIQATGIQGLVDAVENVVPSTGLPLTNGSASGMTGTIKSFTANKVGAQAFKLPQQISADLLGGAIPGAPAAPCTYSTGKQTVGSLKVVKDTAKFSSVKAAGSKLRVAVKNASKTALKPAGKVTAYEGSKKVGSGSLKNGVSSFALKGLKKGKNKLTVKYAGNSQFGPATSSVTVTK